jgi:hypothetical protein
MKPITLRGTWRRLAALAWQVGMLTPVVVLGTTATEAWAHTPPGSTAIAASAAVTCPTQAVVRRRSPVPPRSAPAPTCPAPMVTVRCAGAGACAAGTPARLCGRDVEGPVRPPGAVSPTLPSPPNAADAHEAAGACQPTHISFRLKDATLDVSTQHPLLAWVVVLGVLGVLAATAYALVRSARLAGGDARAGGVTAGALVLLAALLALAFAGGWWWRQTSDQDEQVARRLQAIRESIEPQLSSQLAACEARRLQLEGQREAYDALLPGILLRAGGGGPSVPAQKADEPHGEGTSLPDVFQAFMMVLTAFIGIGVLLTYLQERRRRVATEHAKAELERLWLRERDAGSASPRPGDPAD